MTDNTTKASKDNEDRLMNVAFWYWEHMRRNPQYRRYCDVIEYYKEYFDRLGELAYLDSKEGLEEHFSYFYDTENDYDVKNNPYKTYLEATHGLEAGLKYFKFAFLSEKFRSKFKRIYKHYSIGIDTEKYLTSIISDNDISFETRDHADIASLIRMHEEWSIKIDDSSPTYYIYHLEDSGPITVDPQGILNAPATIGLEAYAINLIHKSIRGLVKKQSIDTDTFAAVYKISVAGKNINSADKMRLAILWLWDKAHEADYANPAPFNEVYPLLKDKLKSANVSGGVWEQVLYRRSRILGYYKMLTQSISQLTVLPLQPQ